jgi:hypothetical protein
VRKQPKPTIHAAAASQTGDDAQAFRLTAAVALTAAAGEGKRPTFEIAAYTGAVMTVEGFYTPVIVDLTGLRAARGKLPVLLDHDRSQIVGQGTAKIDSAGVRISGTVTADDGAAGKVVAHARNGFEWQASIGASVVRREFLEAGKRAVVNGREVTGPIIIAREAALQEVSFVAIGADGQSSAAIAANHTGDPAMNFETWLKAKGFDPATLTAEVKKSLEAMWKAETAPAPANPATPPTTSPANPPAVPPAAPIQAGGAQPPANPPIQAAAPVSQPADIVAQIRAESVRIAEIDRLCGNDQALAEVRAQAIREGWPAERVELHVLRAGRGSGPAIHVLRHDVSPDITAAAIAVAGGLSDVEKAFKPEHLEAAQKRYRRGIGLQELFLEAAWAGGYSGGISAIRNDLANVLRAAFSTLTLPGIMANTANKFLLEGFMHVDQAWQRIAATRPVNDFKTVTSYRMSGGFQFLKVGPGGELKHDTVSEDSFTNKADTYGRMFAITRQDMINDDLGALTAVPRRIGRGGALKLNDVFWTAFLDNSSFFAAGNNNYFEGASTNLQSSSLKTAVEKFLKQTDPDGKPVAIMPKILLVPPEESVTADELYVSTNNNSGGAATTAKIPNRNTFAGKYEPVTSPYLSNSSYTGYSTTAWYLLADPNDLATIEVCFLNGQQSPTVESAEADFNVLGVQMRGYFDFGVTKQDYRAGVKSKGAA